MIDQWPMWQYPPTGGSGASIIKEELKQKPRVTLYSDVFETINKTSVEAILIGNDESNNNNQVK